MPGPIRLLRFWDLKAHSDLEYDTDACLSHPNTAPQTCVILRRGLLVLAVLGLVGLHTTSQAYRTQYWMSPNTTLSM